tara:strand:- start:154 stop:672 length:519 start_codon:yes stop_codon:yes gene_type:complete
MIFKSISMANSKFYLKDKKTSNETIILMYFNYNNHVLKYSTKTSTNPSNWNKKNCRVKQQAAHSLEINRKIQKIADAIMDIYLQLQTNNIVINNKILRKKLDIKLDRQEKEDFFTYMKLYIDQKNELKNTTKKDYLQTLKTLKNFESHTSYLVSFENINIDFYTKIAKLYDK